MKALISAIIAFGFFAGTANASTIAPAKTDTVVEWGCGGYGH